MMSDLSGMTKIILAQMVTRLETENAELKKMFHDLTPGGSEFVDDPKRCYEYLQGRNNLVKELKKKVESMRCCGNCKNRDLQGYKAYHNDEKRYYAECAPCKNLSNWQQEGR